MATTAFRFSASLLIVLVISSVRKYSAAAGKAFFEHTVAGKTSFMRMASTSLNSVNRRCALVTFSSFCFITRNSCPATAAPCFSVPSMASVVNRSIESLEMDSSLRMNESTNTALACCSGGRSLDDESSSLRTCSLPLDLGVPPTTVETPPEGSPILETFLEGSVPGVRKPLYPTDVLVEGGDNAKGSFTGPLSPVAVGVLDRSALGARTP
mmetsp:Transcript_5725/g.9887  ORF Transcript_5725/g.9887 Transcript_5725/m.9887 type:complete len:211 (-) Transcript_5725:1587-2219(-)